MLSLVKLRSSFERPQLRVAAPNQLRGMPKANASAFTRMLRRIINSHKVNEIRRQKSKLNTAHATTQSIYNDNTEFSTCGARASSAQPNNCDGQRLLRR